MPNAKVLELIKKIISDSSTEEERNQLNIWLRLPENREYLQQMMEEMWFHNEVSESITTERADVILQSIINTDKGFAPKKSRKKSPKFIWYAAASIVIMITGISGYFLALPKHKVGGSVSQVRPNADQSILRTGRKTATLTLDDGTQITLDTASAGLLTRQGQSQIVKGIDELSYTENKKQGTNLSCFNTLKTQRGEQYSLVLSDGTKVWLNASSSIRFPVVFTGKERKVDIIGEVYFEVKKQPQMPFKVSTRGMDVEVLGTHFNVNAYEDETAIKTTLLEGSVKLRNSHSAVMLTPGQQGIVSNAAPIKIANNVDIEQVVSWKDGYFHFTNASLRSVLLQISRWYDVEIVNADNLPDEHFDGDIDRTLQLGQVIQILKRNKVHLAVNGNQLIILK